MRPITPTLALPATATAQLQALVELFLQALGASLAGIVLHGSAATSGFDPARSDLDLLVIVTRVLSPGQCQALGTALLRISGRPHPVELSVVTQAALAQWTHPCPYEFHYGESQRVRFAAGHFAPQYAGDPDLAAHLILAKARGVDLLSTYPPAQLPDIPRTDYLAALLSDFGWAADQAENLDDYVLANACRTMAYLQTGEILSKTEGVDWCRKHAVDMSTVVAAVVSALCRARQDEQAITTA
jgi:streptomycin 3"-adenylyltransferase